MALDALSVGVTRKRAVELRGDVVIVRYADDFVVGFEHRVEAEAFLADLKARLADFRLELHPEKTRLLEFGRYARKNRAQRGEGKPETLNFLGFTHCCARTRKGRFMVLRRTQGSRMRAKLEAVGAKIRRRINLPVPEVGKWLRRVLQGHDQYYGVPGNYHQTGNFYYQVIARRRLTHCRPNVVFPH